ncbi:uncharacterized protein [Paramisgurnus dabryanus]|uniref:uncharacterized protein isoform X2 n=1 Tax=Paramisgurnus dabryanus TaxID=90735 RepID=UPI0031F39163
MKIQMDMMKILRNETSQLFRMQTVSLKFILVILWLITGGECRTVTVQTGGSVVIPCHYESKYTQNKKYWCFDTRPSYDYCSFLAYSNETNRNVSVIDHPDQSLFTVTMRDLQEQNTGTYWCAIKIEGAAYDVTEWFYITIQSAPEVSVMSSSVTVDEGGNISVQCLYTSTYKKKHKQWCRYKDKRCYTVGRSDTSQNASVEISDDRRESLTVVMSGLMKSDSGWYYCSVGDLQAPVQLTVTVAKVSVGNSTPVKFINVEPTTSNTVTDGEPTTVPTFRSSLTSKSNQLTVTTQSHLSTASHVDRHTALPTITPTPKNNNQISSTKEPKSHRQYLKLWLLPIVLILLLILVTVTSEILRNKHKRKNNHITHEKKDEASDKDDSVNSSSVNPECDVTYISVIKLPKTKADDSVNSSSVNPECDVTYSSVINLAKTEACEPADVEENVIYSSLCV